MNQQHWGEFVYNWLGIPGGGAISWASKKQTCITSSTIESEFVALAAAGKKAEWLKNLLLKISLWSKPIAPILSGMIVLLHWQRLIAICTMGSLDQWQRGKGDVGGRRRGCVLRHIMGRGLVGSLFLRMCLEPAEKEDEVVNFLMVNFFEKMLSMSMNKEEPPM
ncbi:zinc finger, CCHC-type containing protein [Tanacetum coccineum]|uniref:Zinc finger, CCHC-type containing protein n=1 Tax=Tanacetum coccineum TaxID=301880 RepID=A0ABQ5A1F1_9ASTR